MENNILKITKHFFATCIALEGSIQFNRKTFGATNLAQRPLPHPISKPSAEAGKIYHGKMAKYCLNATSDSSLLVPY